jgi:hypothetical protein
VALCTALLYWIFKMIQAVLDRKVPNGAGPGIPGG